MNPGTLAVLKGEEAAGEAGRSRGIVLAERARLFLDRGMLAEASQDVAADAAIETCIPANIGSRLKTIRHGTTSEAHGTKREVRRHDAVTVISL